MDKLEKKRKLNPKEETANEEEKLVDQRVFPGFICPLTPLGLHQVQEFRGNRT